MPTVTNILEPERACRTLESVSKSLTLEMLLAFNSPTTFAGGNGCEAEVPQFTPKAAVALGEVKMKRVNSGNNVMKSANMWETIAVCSELLWSYRGIWVGKAEVFQFVTMVAKVERQEGRRNVKWKNKADSNFQNG